MKIIKQLFVLIIITTATRYNVLGQANPYINVLPSNSGIVTTGGVIDIIVTIGNTGPISAVPKAKLRPIIEVPPSVMFLPTAQQSGLPTGWTILTNTGSQIRICNSNDSIPVNTLRVITLKVQGITVSPPQAFTGNIFFGNGTTCAAGTQVSGDNVPDNSATSSIQVVPGCSLGITATSGTILCNGDSTIITANATNATGPVEYNISGNPNYQTNNIFTVPAGTYTVTAREVNNPIACITHTTLIITEPDTIPHTIVNVIEPTCTNPLGVVTVTSNTTGLFYSIDGGPFASYPASGYQLSSGVHSIEAKDSINCIAPIANFTISTQPPTPNPPQVDGIIQPTCSVSTGSAQLSNLPSGQWILNPGNISGNTSSFTINNIPAGIYNFNVTNSFGCVSANTSSITINTVLGAPLAPSINVFQPTCTVATGSIVVTSPDPNLLYSLDGGVFSAYPSGGYTGIATGNHSIIAKNTTGCLSPFTNFTINPQPLSPLAPIINIIQPTCTKSTGKIEILSDTTDLTFSLDGSSYVSYPINGFTANPGIHTLAVQNLSGCAPTIVNNIVIAPQPQTPTINISATPITCNGDYSTITALANGGLAPYEFSVNDTIFQSPNTFILQAGSYQFYVRDSNGCMNKTDTIIITQPLPITGTATATPINCFGDSSILTISASGGVGAYEYNINSGNYQSANTFKVPAGDYKVGIRLKENPLCFIEITPIVKILQPNELKIVASYDAIKYCGDSSNIDISAIGGKPPYLGIGSFIKGPGVWNFNVEDANGCVAFSTITLLPPGCTQLNVHPNPAFDVIKINHSASLGSETYFQLFTANGDKVMDRKVPEGSFYTTIDISELALGDYILVYINGNEKKVAKITKLLK